MLDQKDKQRQKRHRKRLEAGIDATALVIGINDYCFNPQLFSLINAMLGELSVEVKSRIHFYGIDSGACTTPYLELAATLFNDHHVPFYYAGIDHGDDLPDHYAAIDVLMVLEDNTQSMNSLKSALSAGCTVIAKSKIAAKINLNIKDRLRISDQACANELSGHIAALTTYRRKFDCALAS